MHAVAVRPDLTSLAVSALVCSINTIPFVKDLLKGNSRGENLSPTACFNAPCFSAPGRRALLTIRTANNKQLLQIPADTPGGQQFLDGLIVQLQSQAIDEEQVVAKKNDFMQKARSQKLLNCFWTLFFAAHWSCPGELPLARSHYSFICVWSVRSTARVWSVRSSVSGVSGAVSGVFGVEVHQALMHFL